MKQLHEYADHVNKLVVLTPSSDFGGSITRLNKFTEKMDTSKTRVKNAIFPFKQGCIEFQWVEIKGISTYHEQYIYRTAIRNNNRYKNIIIRMRLYMVPNRLNGENSGDSIIRKFQEKWETEPEFVDLKKEGYHLVIFRHPEYKHLNGYVGINRCHPCFGKDANDKIAYHLHAHGGITFSAHHGIKGFKRNYWYFGFDTAHYHDYVPGLKEIMDEMKELKDPLLEQLDTLMMKFGEINPISKTVLMPATKNHYKDIDYVSREVVSLYEQLMEISTRNPHYKHSFRKEYRRLRIQKRRMNGKMLY